MQFNYIEKFNYNLINLIIINIEFIIIKLN